MHLTLLSDCHLDPFEGMTLSEQVELSAIEVIVLLACREAVWRAQSISLWDHIT